VIDRIRKAIRDFRAAPPDGSDAWESWRTPQPWETRVLSNLERYHRHLKAAVTSYDAGDIKPITHEASSYAGLAKDLDFDVRWMTAQNRDDGCDPPPSQRDPELPQTPTGLRRVGAHRPRNTEPLEPSDSSRHWLPA
jgi:hypothetical protein